MMRDGGGPSGAIAEGGIQYSPVQETIFNPGTETSSGASALFTLMVSRFTLK